MGLTVDTLYWFTQNFSYVLNLNSRSIWTPVKIGTLPAAQSFPYIAMCSLLLYYGIGPDLGRKRDINGSETIHHQSVLPNWNTFATRRFSPQNMMVYCIQHYYIPYNIVCEFVVLWQILKNYKRTTFQELHKCNRMNTANHQSCGIQPRGVRPPFDSCV